MEAFSWYTKTSCAAAILCFMLGLQGQTCCSGGVPLSNNLGLPNEGLGAFILGVTYDYNNLNTLNAGRENLEDESRVRNTHSILLNFGYGLGDHLAVEALLSWVKQTREISQFEEVNLTETKGIGDAVFLLKYSLPEILGSESLLTIGAGTKIPLGASDLVNEQGILLTADLQPGSGAWDGIAWFSFSQGLNFRPSATVSLSFTYRLTGKNSRYLNNTSIYEFGNTTQANLGYTDQFFLLNTVFNPGLVLKYRHASEDQINGSLLPNTGGEWVFLRPELGVNLKPELFISTRAEIPIYSFVEGTQLTPSVRVSVGLTYVLKPKTNNLLNSTP